MAEPGFATVPSGGTTDQGLGEASVVASGGRMGKALLAVGSAEQRQRGRAVAQHGRWLGGWGWSTVVGMTGDDGVGERPHSGRALPSLRAVRNPSGE